MSERHGTDKHDMPDKAAPLITVAGTCYEYLCLQHTHTYRHIHMYVNQAITVQHLLLHPCTQYPVYAPKLRRRRQQQHRARRCGTLSLLSYEHFHVGEWRGRVRVKHIINELHLLDGGKQPTVGREGFHREVVRLCGSKAALKLYYMHITFFKFFFFFL